MSRRIGRVVPALAAAIVAVSLGVGSVAVAGGDHHARSHHGGGWHHHKGCHGKCFSAWDEQWLMMAIQGDRFEIAGGQLAQQKGTNAAVRNLAARVVADHTKSLQEAVALAERLGIPVPGSPSPTQEWQLRVVATFSGGAFDRWYSDLEVQGHRQDIMAAEAEVAKGCNDKIRGLAAAELPVLREHLALAEAALEASGG